MMHPSWEREAMGLEPVFIVGAPRSGTSILYRSLQSHPTFTPALGIHLVESRAMNILPTLLGPRDVRWTPLANFLTGRIGMQALAGVAQDIAPLALRRRLVRRLSLGRMGWTTVWKAAGEHHVVRRYFLEAHRRRGAKRLVEKTPSTLARVPHLKIAFPNARFLFIIRHPVDTLGSYWKRYQTDPEHPSWANIAPDDFVTLWGNGVRHALNTAKREPQFMLIRYEDFTLDAEETMRRVCAHVGETFHEACLLREPASISAEREQELRQMGHDIHEGPPETFAALMTVTKRWEDYVDPALARTIESQLSSAMSLLRYEPKAPSRATEPD